MDYAKCVGLCSLLCIMVLAIFVPDISCGLRLPLRPKPSKRTWKCPTLNLTNGIVHIRSKGRVGRYLCNTQDGYKLVGERTATCVKGHWEGNVPLCVKSGCLKVYAPENGQVREFYAGAVLSFICDDGYTMNGSKNIYCDGIAWNGTVPTCQVDNLEPKTFCDFESEDLCGWTQDSKDNFDWKRHNFATPSGHVRTGPSNDHTKGKGQDGYYMYIESSPPRMVNDTALLVSPFYPASSSQDGCFVFWYHMYGATIGYLRVYQKPHGSEFGALKPLFSRSANQGNQWLRAIVRLQEINNPFQIIVEGVRGTLYTGDSAIDDVLLSNGTDCTEPAIDTSQSMPPKIDTGGGEELYDDAQSCRLRCTSSPNYSALSDDESTLETPVMLTCDCHVGCLDNATCCPDYSSYCIMAKVTPMPVVPPLEHRTIVSVHYIPRSTLPSPPPLPPLPPPPNLPPLLSPSTLPSLTTPSKLLPVSPPLTLAANPQPLTSPPETTQRYPPGFPHMSRYPSNAYFPPKSPKPTFMTTKTTNLKQNTQLFKPQTSSSLFEDSSIIPTELSFTEIPTTNIITSEDKTYPGTSVLPDTNQFPSTTSIAAETDSAANTITDTNRASFDVNIADTDGETYALQTTEATSITLLGLTSVNEVSTMQALPTTLSSLITTHNLSSSTLRMTQDDIQTTPRKELPVDEVTVVVKQTTNAITKATTPKKTTNFRKPIIYPTRKPYFPKKTTPKPTKQPTTTEAVWTTKKNKMMYYPNSSGEKSKDAETDYLLKKELMDQPKRKTGELWPQPQQSSQVPSSINASTVIGIVGGIALLLVAFGVVTFAVVRRRRAAGGRNSMSDDSDVRFLTADEVLDFNIARPNEEDDCC